MVPFSIRFKILTHFLKMLEINTFNNLRHSHYLVSPQQYSQLDHQYIGVKLPGVKPPPK